MIQNIRYMCMVNDNGELLCFHVELNPRVIELLCNSKKDGRKGDKLVKHWLGPYQVEEVLGKALGVHMLCNPSRG